MASLVLLIASIALLASPSNSQSTEYVQATATVSPLQASTQEGTASPSNSQSTEYVQGTATVSPLQASTQEGTVHTLQSSPSMTPSNPQNEDSNSKNYPFPCNPSSCIYFISGAAGGILLCCAFTITSVACCIVCTRKKAHRKRWKREACGEELTENPLYESTHICTPPIIVQTNETPQNGLLHFPKLPSQESLSALIQEMTKSSSFHSLVDSIDIPMSPNTAYGTSPHPSPIPPENENKESQRYINLHGSTYDDTKEQLYEDLQEEIYEDMPGEIYEDMSGEIYEDMSGESVDPPEEMYEDISGKWHENISGREDNTNADDLEDSMYDYPSQ